MWLGYPGAPLNGDLTRLTIRRNRTCLVVKVLIRLTTTSVLGELVSSLRVIRKTESSGSSWPVVIVTHVVPGKAHLVNC